jgi:glutamate-1-semialdehyde 2,1-aminomutase
MEATRDNIISTTYGGETLSLAAVVASIREYRDKNVVAHLWRIGTALQDGLNEAARAAGLAFEVSGYAPMSSYRFGYDDAQSNEGLMTLLLEEMARRGILFRRGGLLFVNFSHGEREVERTLRAAHRVFPLLTRARERGEVEQRIVSGPANIAIRRA